MIFVFLAAIILAAYLWTIHWALGIIAILLLIGIWGTETDNEDDLNY